MKTKMKLFFTGIIAMAILSTLSCSKEDEKASTEAGYLKLNDINVILDVNNLSGKGMSAKSALLDPSDEDIAPTDFSSWTVTVYDSGGGEVTSVEYGTIPTEGIALKPDTGYTAVVASGTNEVGFEKPYYEGTSSAFRIDADTDTSITVDTTPANAKITVTYANSITSNFDEYATTVTVDAVDMVFDEENFENDDARGYFPYQSDAAIEVVLSKTGEAPITYNYTLPGIADLGTDKAPNYELIIGTEVVAGMLKLAITVDAERNDTDVTFCNENEGGADNFNASTFAVFATNAGAVPFFRKNPNLSIVELVDNPNFDLVNPSCKVIKFTAVGTGPALNFTNVKMFTSGTGTPPTPTIFDLGANKGFKMKVYSENENVVVKLAVENRADPVVAFNGGPEYTVRAGEWTELTFELDTAIPDPSVLKIFLGLNQEITTPIYFDDLIYSNSL